MEDSTSIWLARGRTLAGYLLFALAVLVLIGSVAQWIAVFRFQLTGHITDDFDRSELGWADLLSTLLFDVIFLPACLWVGLILLPDSSAFVRWAMAYKVIESGSDPRDQGAVSGSSEVVRQGDPSDPRQEAKPHRHTRTSRAQEAAVQRQLAERRREDEVRILMESNPDVGTAVQWMSRLLQEQAEANSRDMADAGRKDMRRDLMFFAFGSGLGIAQPLIGPQILGLVWH